MIGNFTGVPIMNIIPDWESEVVDHPGLKKNKKKEAKTKANKQTKKQKVDVAEHKMGTF